MEHQLDREIVAVLRRIGKWRRRRGEVFSDEEIVRTWFWGAIHDRPVHGLVSGGMRRCMNGLDHGRPTRRCLDDCDRCGAATPGSNRGRSAPAAAAVLVVDDRRQAVDDLWLLQRSSSGLWSSGGHDGKGIQVPYRVWAAFYGRRVADCSHERWLGDSCETLPFRVMCWEMATTTPTICMTCASPATACSSSHHAAMVPVEEPDIAAKVRAGYVRWNCWKANLPSDARCSANAS